MAKDYHNGSKSLPCGAKGNTYYLMDLGVYKIPAYFVSDEEMISPLLDVKLSSMPVVTLCDFKSTGN